MKFEIKFLAFLVMLSACATGTPLLPSATLNFDAAQSEDAKIASADVPITNADVTTTDAGAKDTTPSCVFDAEVCDDNIDNNCDGETDESVCTCTVGQPVVLYKDADDDNFGTSVTKTFCVVEVTPAGYATQKGDCNDADASLHPGAEETCEGIDNDCDGITDNGSKCNPGVFGNCYKQNSAKIGTSCSGLYGACAVNGVYECGWSPDNKVALICSTDVNGSQTKVTDEICGDKIDNDCDSVIENGCDPSDLDQDGDGYNGLVDCDDQNPKIFPGNLCPKISGLTHTSMKLVLVDENATPFPANQQIGNQLFYSFGQAISQLEIIVAYGGANVGFSENQYVVFDLMTPKMFDQKFIGFNAMNAEGTQWLECGVDKTTGEYTLTLPKVYLVEYGVWKNVTSDVKLQVVAEPVPSLACIATLALP